jgi:hypothetical protein
MLMLPRYTTAARRGQAWLEMTSSPHYREGREARLHGGPTVRSSPAHRAVPQLPFGRRVRSRHLRRGARAYRQLYLRALSAHVGRDHTGHGTTVISASRLAGACAISSASLYVFASARTGARRMLLLGGGLAMGALRRWKSRG